MDITAINTFLLIAKKQSFSLAAESLYLSQPAISKRIAALESELNCKLFDRLKKKSILTEAGRLFLPRAESIIEELKRCKNDLADMGSTVSGELLIATSHHIGLHYLPPILKQYVSQYPHVDLKLNFMESEAACQAVEHAEIELAIITLPLKPSSTLDLLAIWQDPLAFVVHNHHPLLKELPITNTQPPHYQLSPKHLQQLTHYPAILSEKGTYTRELLDAYFMDSEMKIQVKLSNNFLETIKMMVSVGLGWSILPQTLVDETLTELYIPSFHAKRSLGIVSHKSRTLSLAAQKMVSLITQSSSRVINQKNLAEII